MKRSELVQKINNLITRGYLIERHVSGEDILNLIEKNGMLPPGVHDGTFHDLGMKNYKNEWEPECEAPKCCNGGCHEQD